MGYKEIPLTQGKVALVDVEDYDYLNQFKWYALKRINNTYYAVRNIYLKNGKHTTLRMHRLIMRLPDSMEIDHINGNGLDNRRSNLRICNRSQNMMNCKVHKDNISGYKGVYWDKEKEKWMARIQINGKLKNLGRFDIKEEAAKAYNEAANKYHGEFARLNVIK